MNREIYLQGYFVEYNKYNRMKVMFLDDYEELEKITFSKSYLTQLCKSPSLPGNNPLTDDQKYFYVKCKKGQAGFINDKIAPIQDLLQHKIQINIVIGKYDFRKHGKRFQGWNIKPLKISLIEY